MNSKYMGPFPVQGDELNECTGRIRLLGIVFRSKITFKMRMAKLC